MRAIRLLVTAAILAGGLGAAWPFRHPPAAPPASRDARRVDVPLRRPDIIIRARPAGTASPAADPDEVAAIDPAAGGLPLARPDLGDLAPPPALPQDFGLPSIPTAASPAAESPRWQPVRMKLTAERPAPRQHRLVDGDSLESLAERYLGDAARASEIFELNRSVLPAPDLLPLGRTIRIP